MAVMMLPMQPSSTTRSAPSSVRHPSHTTPHGKATHHIAQATQHIVKEGNLPVVASAAIFLQTSPWTEASRECATMYSTRLSTEFWAWTASSPPPCPLEDPFLALAALIVVALQLLV